MNSLYLDRNEQAKFEKWEAANERARDYTQVVEAESEEGGEDEMEQRRRYC